MNNLNAPSSFSILRSIALALAASTLAPQPGSAQQVRIGSSSPSSLSAGAAAFEAYFAAGDGVHGVEPWFYAPTGVGMLIDVLPGELSSYPDYFVRPTSSSSQTWFVARTVGAGRELHFFPPLGGGSTTLVDDIRPGTLASHPEELTVISTALGPMLVFSADDGVHGRELWCADVAGNVSMLMDIAPGPGSSSPSGITAIGSRVVFAATDSGSGTELWTSDGTTTNLVVELAPGAASSTPAGFAEFGGDAWFAASTPRRGRELWRTDGITASRVTDLALGPADSAPDQITTHPSSGVAFTAWTPGLGRQLWNVDAGGALARRTSFAGASDIGAITPTSARIWFRASTPGRGSELWRTTPSPIAFPMDDIATGSADSFPANLIPLPGGGLLFRAEDLVHGTELWGASAGSPTPTLVRDIRSGPDDSDPSMPVRLGSIGGFLFAAKGVAMDGTESGIELWESAGAAASEAVDLDAAEPLPEMHIELANGFGLIKVSDADPLSPGVLLISPLQSAPITIPGVLRGAIAVDLASGFSVPFMTDQNGRAFIPFSTGPNCLDGTPFGFQAFVATSSLMGIEATNPESCTDGIQSTPAGRTVKVEICVDDESGEYELGVDRIDSLAGPAYIGVYRVTRDPELRKLLFSFPVEAGEPVTRSGRLLFKLREKAGDLSGDFLEVHVFDEPPKESSPTTASLVVTSYC